VFTLASSWEGLPVALMEAMALGLPVVATAVGGVAETLTDGVDAVLVPPSNSDALAAGWLRLANDTNERARFAMASAARADEFDVSRAEHVVEQTYARLAPQAVELATDEAAPKPPKAAKAKRSTGLDIRPATPDDRAAILTLLQRSLGWDDDPRYEQLFRWKHETNAFGPSPTWVAVDGDRIAGVRMFMRWEFVRGGQVLRAVRAVDTATEIDRSRTWDRNRCRGRRRPLVDADRSQRVPRDPPLRRTPRRPRRLATCARRATQTIGRGRHPRTPPLPRPSAARRLCAHPCWARTLPRPRCTDPLGRPVVR